MEIQFIKNNNENNFGGLQMQYMNIMNTINMIQQQINQFINRINQMDQTMNMMPNNNLNLMNQNNFNLQNFNPINNEYNLNNNLNGMNQNNFNLMNNSNDVSNLLGLDNPMFKFMNETRNDYNNQLMNAIFHFSGENSAHKSPIMVQYKPSDLISKFIEKFRKKANYFNKLAKFIFNAKELNFNLTCAEAGLTDDCHIFVIDLPSWKIICKISGMKNVNLPFIIYIKPKQEVSEIIDSFILESGLTRSLILKCVFNSRTLNEQLTIEEAGLKENSEINVYIKNPLYYIFINFKSINSDNMNNNKYIKIECLKTEKIESLLERYKYKTGMDQLFITFSFNSKKIEYDDKKKNIEEFGLKNGSTIIADFDRLIQ